MAALEASKDSKASKDSNFSILSRSFKIPELRKQKKESEKTKNLKQQIKPNPDEFLRYFQDFCDNINNSVSLEELIISQNNLKPQHAKLLGELLAEGGCPYLQELNLCFNLFGNEGAECLVDSLKTNPRVGIAIFIGGSGCHENIVKDVAALCSRGSTMEVKDPPEPTQL